MDPADDLPLQRRRRLQRLIRRQSLAAAAVSVVPLPGVDLLINGKLLVQTLTQISLQHGLSPEQLVRLPKPVRSRVDQAIQEVGSYLIGRVITEALLVNLLKGLGLRLGAQQAAKLAPLAGAAASAALSGWLFKRLCERHLAHCEAVSQQLPPALPAPPRMPGLRSA